jgi:hypothetical protein
MHTAVENIETQLTESTRRVMEISDAHDDLTQHQHDTHHGRPARNAPQRRPRHGARRSRSRGPRVSDVDW